jgi:hypothetical protein
VIPEVSGGVALGILLAHGVGDYLIQTDWMATEKTKRWLPAVAHGVTYGVAYLFVTQSPAALAVIVLTHIVIDRHRLARHVVWFKNLFAPKAHRHPWSECSATGYHHSRPVWLSTWLMIIADNIIHLVINYLAIGFLG